jgi:hypothetical protein
MSRLLSCFLAGVLAASASSAASSRYYALELKGGSQVFSTDVPLKKGRVLVFHRYPDGTYMSVAASEVEKIVARDGEPLKAEKLAPGETVYVGNAVEGPGYVMPEAPPPAPAYGGSYDQGYGYGEYYWGGGYYPPRPPRPPGPPPPSRIGPNGYPIIAPPGTAGSVPPPIGSNGFPILAPPPVVASPRRP